MVFEDRGPMDWLVGLYLILNNLHLYKSLVESDLKRVCAVWDGTEI